MPWTPDQRKHKPKRRYHTKDEHYKYHYGISFGDYMRLFKEQGGLCAICGSFPEKKALGVDHDHATGRIRGLLCGNCNSGLGMFKDSIDRLQAAIDYLG